MNRQYNGEEPHLYSNGDNSAGGVDIKKMDGVPSEAEEHKAQHQRKIEPQGGGWQQALYPKITGVRIER